MQLVPFFNTFARHWEPLLDGYLQNTSHAKDKAVGGYAQITSIFEA